MSKHLGDPVCPGKVTHRCPRPWRCLPNGAISSTGCLKHQSDPSLDSWCPAPTPKERPATVVPYRPRVSKNAECSGGSFPPWSFLPMGVGEQPCQRSTGVWRSRLPPQSFLPVGIGEATPVTNFALFNFVSLHSLSYLWVSGRRPC